MTYWKMIGLSTAIILLIAFLVLVILKKLFITSKVSSLNKKHVLITGGSSGIGKSTALEVIKLGAHVTLVARNETKLQAAVEEIMKEAKFPGEQVIQYFALDVTSGINAVDEVVKSAQNTAGPVYLLVNCAGMAKCGEFDIATESDFRYMMDLNYFGTVFPSVSIAKEMKKRKEGYIVITGSQASLLGIYGMSAYCSSKFALRGFAETLYMELKPYNVSVTLCLPPDTNTPGFENEEKSKPEITRLISETAGLFEPRDVARRLLSDTLNKKFLSSLGFEAFILTTLCAGMSPIGCWFDFLAQVSLMSMLRLVSFGYLLHFQRIIAGHVKSSTVDHNVKKGD